MLSLRKGGETDAHDRGRCVRPLWHLPQLVSHQGTVLELSGLSQKFLAYKAVFGRLSSGKRRGVCRRSIQQYA